MVLLEILNRGVVQPRSDFMIRIVFKPKFDGPTSCSLRVRTNAATPPSVGVGSSDAYGNNTSILEARLSGTGGVGVLAMDFVTVEDRNMNGLDFG